MIKEPREKFINCSTHAVQSLFNEIPKGIPAIDLEVLDPLLVPRLDVSIKNISDLHFQFHIFYKHLL